MSDMEARVSRLETIALDTKASLDRIFAAISGLDGRMAKVETRMVEMDTKIQVIDAKLDSKPDQGWIVNVLGIMLGVFIGTAGVATGALALFVR